jgi:hypothetical protein
MVSVAMVIRATTVFTIMIAVFSIAAITDNLLVMAASIATIPCSHISMMFPWIALINHYFIAMVRVIMVSWRQCACMYPYVIFVINVLMIRYIIVRVNIGHVVIFCVSIAYRAPFGLAVDIRGMNIKAEVYAYLCIGYFVS